MKNIPKISRKRVPTFSDSAATISVCRVFVTVALPARQPRFSPNRHFTGRSIGAAGYRATVRRAGGIEGDVYSIPAEADRDLDETRDLPSVKPPGAAAVDSFIETKWAEAEGVPSRRGRTTSSTSSPPARTPRSR